MKFRMSGAVLAGASMIALASTGAQASSPADKAKIDQLQQQIDALSAQVSDLKRSTSDQYADVARVQASAPKSDVDVTLKNGRPSFKTADGQFSLDIRALVQFDTAYYSQGKAPQAPISPAAAISAAPASASGHAVQRLVVRVHLRLRRLGHRRLGDLQRLYPV